MFRALLILILHIIPANTLFAKNYYVYLDENGNKVFTDRIPDDRNFESFRQQELVTVKWNQQNTSFKFAKNKKQSKQRPLEDKRQLCKKLNTQVKSLQSKLSGRLKPEEFEKLKRRLSQQRWILRKRCK